MSNSRSKRVAASEPPTEELLNAIRTASPSARSSKLLSPAAIIGCVGKIVEGYTSDEVWDGVKYLVDGGDMEAKTVYQDGERILYRLTKQGQQNRPPRALTDAQRDEKSRAFNQHRGKVPCPHCGGDDTATDTAATTFPVVRLFCFDCQRTFRKSSEAVGARRWLDTDGNMTAVKPNKPLIKGVQVMNYNEMTLKELVAHYNKITTGSKVKTFSSKAVAIRRIKGIEKQAAKAKPKGKARKAAAKKTGPSRFQIIRDLLGRRKSITREELMKATGWDARNVHTAMSILKNPERMSKKNLLVTDYDRKSQTYTRAR
jgi:hypothetical protein